MEEKGGGGACVGLEGKHATSLCRQLSCGLQWLDSTPAPAMRLSRASPISLGGACVLDLEVSCSWWPAIMICISPADAEPR